MAYQTLCDRFSMYATVPAAHLVAAGSALSLAERLSLSPEVAFSFGCWAGLGGFIAGAVAEDVSAHILHKKGFGVSRGSRIVQASGLAAYGAVLGAALAFGVATATPQSEENDRKPQGGAPVPTMREHGSAPVPQNPSAPIPGRMEVKFS